MTVLFGDERCVPPDQPDSNYHGVRPMLIDRVAPASVHRIAGELGPDEAAAAYETVVAGLQPLDLVLLGAGPDGHTASLFPGAPELAAKGWVTPVRDAPKPPRQRVSLTLASLRAARHVVVLATGAEKAEALRRALRGEVPAGMIPGARWLVDRALAEAAGVG